MRNGASSDTPFLPCQAQPNRAMPNLAVPYLTRPCRAGTYRRKRRAKIRHSGGGG
jgi:hypothetical protein